MRMNQQGSGGEVPGVRLRRYGDDKASEEYLEPPRPRPRPPSTMPFSTRAALSTQRDRSPRRARDLALLFFFVCFAFRVLAKLPPGTTWRTTPFSQSFAARVQTVVCVVWLPPADSMVMYKIKKMQAFG